MLTYYRPHWTGLTMHAARVAEGLAARGVDVTVLTVRHSRDLAPEEELDGVRVVRLASVGRFSRGQITPELLWAAPRLVREHDIVQVHSPLPEGPFIAAAARLQGRPVLMTHHGDLVMPPGAANQLLQHAGFYVLLLTGMLATATTSYSRDYAAHSPLMQRLAGKLNYVYPPVDIPAPDRAAVAAWRTQLGLEGKTLIGFAGRWVEEKGFDYLLQALPLIRAVRPDAHLVFAGDTQVAYDRFYDKCLPYLEPIREHVTDLGLLRDRQQMADFYALCDLFVQPSRTDMLGLTQVEALLCGTPVVASDAPGVRMAVQETGFGRLAAPRDPRALAGAICDVIGDLDRYRPKPESVRRIFDREVSLARYHDLLNSLLLPREDAPAALSVSGAGCNDC